MNRHNVEGGLRQIRSCAEMLGELTFYCLDDNITRRASDEFEKTCYASGIAHAVHSFCEGIALQASVILADLNEDEEPHPHPGEKADLKSVGGGKND